MKRKKCPTVASVVAEMLSALKLAQSFMEDAVGDNAGHAAYRRDLRKIERAIAKAEGR